MASISLNYSVNTSVSGAKPSSSVSSLLASSSKPVTMTVAQAKSALASGKLPNAKIIVKDTATNVQNRLDDLARIASLGKLSDVVFTSKTPSLTLSKAQLENSSLLAAVSEANIKAASTVAQVTVKMSDALLLWNKKVAGLSYNIRASINEVRDNMDNLSTMNNDSKLASLNISDGVGASLVLSAADASSSLLSKLVPTTSPPQVGIEVIDTAANYDINKATLTLSSNAAKITKVHIVDSADNVSQMLQGWNASDLTSYAPQLDSINVTDSGSVTLSVDQAINTNLTEALSAGEGKPGLVVVDTASNLVDPTKADQLGALRSSYGPADAVKLVAKDTADHIKVKLDALETLSQSGALSDVVATDSKPVMTLSMKELMGHSGVLSAFVAKGGTVKLSDTAANISANLDDIQKYIAAGVVTNKAGGVVVSDGKAIDMNLEQYSRDADVRKLLRTSGGAAILKDVVNLQLGNAPNVVTQYGNNINGITTGAGDDVVYARADKNLTLDLGAGNDTVYLEGNREDWSVSNLGSSIFYRRNSAGTVGSLETVPTPDALDTTTSDYLNGKIGVESTVDANDTSVYEFTNTNSSKKVTVIGAERFGFYTSGIVPKGTLNLLA